MASFLADLSIMQYFLPIFSFILILIIMYAVLQKTKLLSENIRINFMVALCAALLTMFAGNTLELVDYMVPWIVFVLFILVMIFMIFMFFGLDKDTIWERIGTPGIVWTFFIVIIILAMGKVFGPIIPNEGVGTGTLFGFLFQPQILGVIALLLIAMWVANSLTGQDMRPKW